MVDIDELDYLNEMSFVKILVITWIVAIYLSENIMLVSLHVTNSNLLLSIVSGRNIFFIF